jgi:hypothetical protein
MKKMIMTAVVGAVINCMLGHIVQACPFRAGNGPCPFEHG